MTSQAEKIALCTDELNRQAKEIGHSELTADRVKNKLKCPGEGQEALSGRHPEDQHGHAGVNDFDLEVSKLVLRLPSAWKFCC